MYRPRWRFAHRTQLSKKKILKNKKTIRYSFISQTSEHGLPFYSVLSVLLYFYPIFTLWPLEQRTTRVASAQPTTGKTLERNSSLARRSRTCATFVFLFFQQLPFSFSRQYLTSGRSGQDLHTSDGLSRPSSSFPLFCIFFIPSFHFFLFFFASFSHFFFFRFFLRDSRLSGVRENRAPRA